MRTDPEFEELYEAEAQLVFATVYRFCRNREVAEDATNEAFARALERWDRLKDQGWRLGWVVTTALNFARRSLRRLPAPASTAPAEADAEERLDLWLAVRRLPPRQQEALILRYRLGLSVGEIAGVLGCREGTVRTHVARALHTLRGRLGEELDADRR